jgi:hypothetical protein
MDSASPASAVQVETGGSPFRRLAKERNKGKRVKGHEPIINQHGVATFLVSSIYNMATILSFQHGRGDGKTCGGSGE